MEDYERELEKEADKRNKEKEIRDNIWGCGRRDCKWEVCGGQLCLVEK